MGFMKMFEDLFEGAFCGGIKKKLNSREIDLKISEANLADLQNNLAQCNLKRNEVERQKSELAAQSGLDKQENLRKIDELQQQCNIYTAQIDALQSALTVLSQQVGGNLNVYKMLSPSVQAMMDAHYAKYQEARITYIGRNLPGRSERLELDVSDYAQSGIGTAEALDEITKANSKVMGIISSEKCSAHRACDISVSRMKSRVSQYYRYSSDSSTTGQNEYWKIFWETLISAIKYAIGSDCDDWAILTYVLAVTSGVPAKLLRITAGITNSDEPHATLHYFASDLTWRHVNSTTPYSGTDVLNMPKHNDKTDPMGVTGSNVWFAFNHEKQWSGDAVSSGTTAAQWFGHKRIKRHDRVKLFKGVRVYKVER